MNLIIELISANIFYVVGGMCFLAGFVFGYGSGKKDERLYRSCSDCDLEVMRDTNYNR